MNKPDQPKRPMDDEHYRIPGTNTFNFSKWSRENVPKPPAKLKVGDVVVLVTDAEVTNVYQDVDGTPLYATDHGNGYSDSSLFSYEDLAERLKKWAETDGTATELKRLIEWGWITDED